MAKHPAIRAISWTSAPYGDWKVTETEYEKARAVARGEGEVAECANQLVRYCQGSMFIRDEAMKALQAIRGWVAP